MAEAIYLRVRELPVDHTAERTVICDYAADGKLIGVEVIGPDESDQEDE